ncbi:MAG: plastocyanin/azurin family copper-binding protein, partial [Thermoproteota archaeon]|nr:plastocyanin/azurin family copper-binding protein [Thermoproteota archaeon]
LEEEQEQQEEQEEEGGQPPTAQESATAPANTISATILPGSSAQGNPDYDPDPITINQGDGVQWTNEDNAPHTVTSSQEGVFDSGLINPADTWLLNSAEIAPAEYEYYCTLHPFMVATLVVSDGAATPSQSSENATATQGAASVNNQSGASANSTAGINTTTTAAVSSASPASGSVTTVSIIVGASVPANGQFYDPNNVETPLAAW